MLEQKIKAKADQTSKHNIFFTYGTFMN